MPLRVIAGKAKGRKLKTVPGDSTRPIMDRVKESLFAILGDWVTGSRWIDLFAGTGSVGIEALSRGAVYCLFVDTSRAAIATIHENLRQTRLEEYAVVRRADALAMLQAVPSNEDRVEMLYVAPPQYKQIWRHALELIDVRPEWLLPEGIVVIQIDPKEYEAVSLEHLRLYDQRRYGNTMLCFYERVGEE